MKYFAVTVTYGDRIKYLEEVVSALLAQRIDAIVIVINGSSGKCTSQIKTLFRQHGNITLIDLGENTGSANGFSEGMNYAYRNGADFIWLLDDDNKPQAGALNALKNNWEVFNPDNLKLVSLLSYRSDRNVYRDAIQAKNPFFMLGPKNSFLGFDLVSKLKNAFSKSKIENDTSITEGNVAVAPYGGMFFNRHLIDVIGYPDKDFFLYADDHDFSYRITQKEGEILLVLDSRLIDLETSFHLKKTSRIFNTRFFGTDSKDAIYYSVRNNVFFEKHFVLNRFLYGINKYLYIFLLSFMMILHPKNLWKFSLILKAISDSKKFKNND